MWHGNLGLMTRKWQQTKTCDLVLYLDCLFWQQWSAVCKGTNIKKWLYLIFFTKNGKIIHIINLVLLTDVINEKNACSELQVMSWVLLTDSGVNCACPHVEGFINWLLLDSFSQKEEVVFYSACIRWFLVGVSFFPPPHQYEPYGIKLALLVCTSISVGGGNVVSSMIAVLLQNQ